MPHTFYLNRRILDKETGLEFLSEMFNASDSASKDLIPDESKRTMPHNVSRVNHMYIGGTFLLLHNTYIL